MARGFVELLGCVSLLLCLHACVSHGQASPLPSGRQGRFFFRVVGRIHTNVRVRDGPEDDVRSSFLQTKAVKFVEKRLLGQGTFGAVFKIQKTDTEQKDFEEFRAFKVLLTQSTKNVKKGIRECIDAQRVHSPYVMQCAGYYVFDGNELSDCALPVDEATMKFAKKLCEKSRKVKKTKYCVVLDASYGGDNTYEVWLNSHRAGLKKLEGRVSVGEKGKVTGPLFVLLLRLKQIVDAFRRIMLGTAAFQVAKESHHDLKTDNIQMSMSGIPTIVDTGSVIRFSKKLKKKRGNRGQSTFTIAPPEWKWKKLAFTQPEKFDTFSLGVILGSTLGVRAQSFLYGNEHFSNIKKVQEEYKKKLGKFKELFLLSAFRASTPFGPAVQLIERLANMAESCFQWSAKARKSPIQLLSEDYFSEWDTYWQMEQLKERKKPLPPAGMHVLMTDVGRETREFLLSLTTSNDNEEEDSGDDDDDTTVAGSMLDDKETHSDDDDGTSSDLLSLPDVKSPSGVLPHARGSTPLASVREEMKEWRESDDLEDSTPKVSFPSMPFGGSLPTPSPLQDERVTVSYREPHKRVVEPLAGRWARPTGNENGIGVLPRIDDAGARRTVTKMPDQASQWAPVPPVHPESPPTSVHSSRRSRIRSLVSQERHRSSRADEDNDFEE